MKSEKQRKHLRHLAKLWKKGKHSEKTKEKIRKALKGNKLRVGKKHTEKSKQKMRRAHKATYRDGKVLWNKGKTGVYSKETRRRIGEGRIGQKPANWKGGSWIYWQRKALERDNYTCQNCGLKEPEIAEACHLIPIKGLKNRVKSGNKLNKLDNLVTLCPNCHKRFDKGLIEVKNVKR